VPPSIFRSFFHQSFFTTDFQCANQLQTREANPRGGDVNGTAATQCGTPGKAALVGGLLTCVITGKFLTSEHGLSLRLPVPSSGRVLPRGQLMVDRFKPSLEQLVAPLCPDCHSEMGWTRSTLVGVEPTEIVHVLPALVVKGWPRQNQSSESIIHPQLSPQLAAYLSGTLTAGSGLVGSGANGCSRDRIIAGAKKARRVTATTRMLAV